jgi:type IV secretory pathway VirD2 relaxase
MFSPERGSKMDLTKFTRDAMTQIELDSERKLEWVAVIHRNTDHHHVHIALRGIDTAGQEVRFTREFIRNSLLEIGRDLATRQLGYRITPASNLHPTGRRYGLVEVPRTTEREP